MVSGAPFPAASSTIYIIILDPDERTTTVRSNDTLVDTPFHLISGFFHVNQGVFCCAGVCWRGGGGNRLPGIVTKQQAVEFPQVQTSLHNNTLHTAL